MDRAGTSWIIITAWYGFCSPFGKGGKKSKYWLATRLAKNPCAMPLSNARRLQKRRPLEIGSRSGIGIILFFSLSGPSWCSNPPTRWYCANRIDDEAAHPEQAASKESHPRRWATYPPHPGTPSRNKDLSVAPGPPPTASLPETWQASHVRPLVG